MTEGFPRALLRIEGGAQLATAVFFYQRSALSWLLFAVLLLAPDLSALGYVFGAKTGAYAYNIVHLELWPLMLIVIGGGYDNPLALSIGLIWIAHIGGDRLLGFGLKYPSDFKDTHLGRLPGGHRAREVLE